MNRLYTDGLPSSSASGAPLATGFAARRAAAAAGVVLLAATLGLGASALQTPGTGAGDGLPLPPGATFDPGLTRLLTPASAAAGVYGVYVTSEPIADVAAFFRTAPGASTAHGRSWLVVRQTPLEAFGTAGIFDRTRLARLFAGRGVRTARGALIREGQVVAAVTLVAPVPDLPLAGLRAGTMIVVFRLDRDGDGSPVGRGGQGPPT